MSQINPFKKLAKAATAASMLCAVMFASHSASAAPISTASFGIAGGFTLPSGSNLGNTNAIFISNGGMISVYAGDTGSLAGIVNVGDSGTLKDLPNISGFTSISNFISLSDGVSVDLNTLSLIGQTGPAPGFINLAGNVVIHAPGFDATDGTLTFTGTSSDNKSFTLAVTTSTSSTPGVPEPMSLVLMGLGLIGLFAIGKRQGFATIAT